MTDHDTEIQSDGEVGLSAAARHGHHPTPQQYVQVAVVLAVLTALEIAASFVEIGVAFIPTLLGLMAIKFVLVAGWFMHLKFDTIVYRRFMVGGLVLAGFLYAIVLVSFSGKIDLP